MIFNIKNRVSVKVKLKEPQIKLNQLIDAIKYSTTVMPLEGYQDIIQLYDDIKLESSHLIADVLEVKFNLNIEVETTQDLVKDEVLELSKKIISECILFNNLLFEDELSEIHYPIENFHNLYEIKAEVSEYTLVS